MKIKICGITNLDDALAAAELGADYLGFNFYPKSPRSIAELECEKFVAALKARSPHPICTGVFVNHPPADIARIVKRCGLDAAQLSGDESLEAMAALAAEKIRVFKAVRTWKQVRSLPGFASFGSGEPALLLDATVPGAYGGTGTTVDWDWAASIAKRFSIFLAGGLTAENVAEAMRRVKPWGVDVASGVESSPGKKDHKKIAVFIEVVHLSENELSVRIESAVLKDAVEILALQKLAYQSEAELNDDYSIPPLTQTLPELEAEIDRQCVLKAVENDRIIGSVRAEISGGTCRIGRLIVHPERQNQGIGTQLMYAVESRFAEAERYELFTSERSERNLNLYRKMGYREFKREPLNERVTLVYLEKRVEK
jgi:phosphoribosylanthranilate isomerase